MAKSRGKTLGVHPPLGFYWKISRDASAQVSLRDTATHGLFTIDPTVSMWGESVLYYEDFLNPV